MTGDLGNLGDLVVLPPKECKDGICDRLPLDEERIQLAQMVSLGKSISDIAVTLDRSVTWVRTHKKDPEVMELINTIHQDSVEAARATIINGTTQAAQTILDLSKYADKDSTRLAAAKDILDRIGMKAPDKKQIETNVTINSVPREERLSSIQARAARLGFNISLESGDQEVVIDVPYSE